MKTCALSTTVLLALALPAFAQQDNPHDPTTMPSSVQDDDGGSTQSSDSTAVSPHPNGHAGMNHDAMQHPPPATSSKPPTAADHAMMDHVAAQPNQPIPALTEADREAAFPELHTHADHTPGLNSYVLLDHLEGWNRDSGSGQAWKASAWIGGDIDRLWLRSEGDRSQEQTQSGDLEALYGHAISPWWDLLVGLRQQFRADTRTWAAVGVQGQAPYKFELQATAYFSDGGSGLLKLEGDYDLLLTNRLILQPSIEANLALSHDAPSLSDGDSLQGGLRLRYEITRRFAPYLGWEHERRFGRGADTARDHGEPVHESRFVVGVRIWF